MKGKAVVKHLFPRAFRAMAIVWLLLPVPNVTAHGANPSGARRLPWQAEHIRAVTSIDMDSRLGGRMLIRSTDAARVEQREGRSCVVGAILLFDVDDSFGFDVDETVTVEVTLDRTTTNGLLYYDDHAERRVVAQERRLADGPRWQSVRLELERARLSNRLRMGADFALAAPGADALSRRPGDSGEIAVCGLRIERAGGRRLQSGPKGALRVHVRDVGGGAPTPVRVGLYDRFGRLPRPSAMALEFRRWEDEWIRQTELAPGLEAWPYDDRFVFFIDGRYEAELETGTYELIVGKGPEYRIVRQPVVIEAGKPSVVEIELERWIDMPSRGWYSSDSHVHFARERRDDGWISTLMQAEDIHVANLLQMGNLAGYAYPQYAFGPDGHHVVGAHALVSGQESPRTMQLGHTIGLNATRYHHPADYFSYDRTAKDVRADGGLFGYAHAGDGVAEVMRTDAGLALDVAAGLVDFVEILQGAQLGPGLLYDYLNLGFRMTPSAGTDWPYIALPGAERMYVQIGKGDFSVDGFFAGLKAGRVFVSNGPMLELEVNGLGMGSDVRIAAGERVRVRATARQNPDLGPLQKLELIVHGEIVDAVERAGGSDSLEIEFEFTPETSAWLAVRASGSKKAHSAPVYLIVDGEQRFWKPTEVPMIVERIRKLLMEIPTQRIDWSTQHEKDAVSRELLQRSWEKQKAAVAERASRAIRVYESLRDEHDILDLRRCN